MAVPLDPDAPLSALSGVGPTLAKRLGGLGLASVGDLLAHMPTRYLAVRDVRPLAEWGPGAHARIEVTVSRARARRGGRVMLTEASAEDDQGTQVSLVWFGQRWLARQLPGKRIVCEGVLAATGRPRMEVRSHVLAEDLEEAERAAGLRAVYPATEGLSQARLHALIGQALERAVIPDPLPDAIRDRLGLATRAQAIAQAHRPADADAAREGRRRLAFDELLAGQLVLRLVRMSDQRRPAPDLGAGTGAARAVADGLPFAMSPGQERLWRALVPRLSAARPSRVLVQGEVGAGKTVIGALALAQCAGAGRLGVLLCPTELLARQHRRSLEELLAPTGHAPLLLTGSVGAAERRRVHDALEAGGGAVLVGTHAVLGSGGLGAGPLGRLGLVVVDEQHRFGVAQRHQLIERAGRAGNGVHLLQLTATPIPRSLALTAFGDMDVLTLPQRPGSRRRVRTELIGSEEVARRIRSAVESGGQAFVVVPRIGAEDEPGSLLSADLRERVLDGFPVAVAHGRQGAEERAGSIEAFARGEHQVLLATTVIEVGIDIPTASLMVVIGADAFGLAQLHQLRGRVGRAGQGAQCLLVPSPDAGPEALARLELLAGSDDGLELARHDLAQRGAGDLHGDQQAGGAGMRIARLERDGRTLAEARYAARLITRADPGLSHPAHAQLRAELAARLSQLLRLARG